MAGWGAGVYEPKGCLRSSASQPAAVVACVADRVWGYGPTAAWSAPAEVRVRWVTRMSSPISTSLSNGLATDDTALTWSHLLT